MTDEHWTSKHSQLFMKYKVADGMSIMVDNGGYGKPFGRFHSLILTGLQFGRPNMVILVVEMPRGLLLPLVVCHRGPEGTFTV